MIRNQMTMQEARRLLDYRDGDLYWRQAGSGRRTDLRATVRSAVRSADRVQINIGGGMKLDAHYAVWNWHHGITRHQIVFANGDRSDIRIENLREIEKVIGPQSARKPMMCPCCSQSVPVPTAYVVAVNCDLKPMEARVLEAIWEGGGLPVHTEKIFDRMYADDPDGGPAPARMYSTLKESMVGLRKKLAGSGVGIETVGYRAGWRLVLG